MKKTLKKLSTSTFLLIFTFTVIISLSVFYFLIHTMEVRRILDDTHKIYHHPLQVSNSALLAKLEVYKMYRHMKDVVLSDDNSDLASLEQKVANNEKEVYRYLKVIEGKILGAEGLLLTLKVKELFFQWKAIRSKVFEYQRKHQGLLAIAITKNEGARHVEKLDESMHKLYNYAQNKARVIIVNSEEKYQRNYAHSLYTLFFFVLFSGLLAFVVTIIMRRYQQRLQSLTIRYEYAISGTKDGLWDWDLIDDSIYFSVNWKGMLGYTDEEMANDFASWQDNVHPEDLEKAEKDINDNIEGKTKTYENIHRLRHKNGSWVWILDRGQTIFDKKGKAIRMVGFHTDITKQKELEAKLRDSQKQFEYFMEFMPASIMIKDTEHIIYANQTVLDFFDTKNVVGKTFLDLLSSEIAEKFSFCESRCIKNGTHEEVIDIVTHHIKKVYRCLFFRIETEDIQRVGIVMIDITIEYQSNKEISRLLSAFERSNVSVVMTSLSGVIEYVNPSWCKVTGYKKEELIGENPRIVKSGDISAESYTKMWNELTAGRVWNSEIKNRAKDGSEFWEDSTIIPTFDKRGDVDGYIAFKIPINDKVRLQKELEDKEEMMIIQSRHAAMGEMISMIAHQWRQPISVISMGANNMLADIELELSNDEDILKHSQEILDQTQYLSQTIDNFRDFFKSDKELKNIYLEDAINETLGLMSASFSQHMIKVQTDYEYKEKVPLLVQEFQQVLISVLNNAKDAILENENLDTFSIKIHVALVDKEIVVSIYNTGKAIPEEIIQTIFEPYVSTKKDKNGTGLGLYISKTIVQTHLHGRIWAENHDDGVCFYIAIPEANHGEN